MPHTSVDNDVVAVTREARVSSRSVRLLPGPQKNAFLLAWAEALSGAADGLLKAARDDATHARAHGAPTFVVQALALGRSDLEAKARLAATLAGLPDPVGRVESTWIRPNGLKIEKVRVPLGVVAVLAEYDLGGILDAVLLCLKAGNATVLFAGPMVYRTCRALVRALSGAPLPAQMGGLPLHLVPGHGDDVRRALIRHRDSVDVAIPVGSRGWVDSIVAESRVPVLAQTSGRRHVYLDEEADADMALGVVADLVVGDAGCDGPDTILVHRALASGLLPAIAGLLLEKTVPFSVDAQAAALLAEAHPSAAAAGGDREGIVHVSLVDNLEAAAAAIAAHGPGYSDAIVTNDRAVAARFAVLVDSACVYLNASARFTDGVQFGMGAQVTVSTGRLHARGPVGIDELTTWKYLVSGKGQVLG
jgi:glutamate-5-semialdehyde dehydrogenase